MHSRVADSVAATIAKDNTIHVIGLLGGWGSGKSTVVRHIEKRLGGGENLHFFSYDAWLHQNDPPRRAFLEALIGDLTAANHIERAEWEPRLAELSGKAEETKTETTRQFSETGRAIFLALAFVPFGLAFLDFDLIDRAFGSGGRGIARPLLGLSLLAILAPLLVVMRYYLKWRPWPAQWNAGGWKVLSTCDFWRDHDVKHRGKSVVALLTNHSIELSENRTRISPEPTAIEFRSVFNDLLTACWIKKRRLIIVIDNLDRLAEDDAMQLWATIRSLFLGNSTALVENAKLPAPTIILPIDETAIKRMFSTQHEALEAELLSEAFIDKTFDITFQINEPVMSDWRAYFAAKLREAFGTIATPDHIYWATKIVEQTNLGTSASKRVTPRKLIKLINGAGALLVQWGDGTIDPLTMLLYASRRTDISADVASFVGRKNMVIETPVSDWRRQLLALHFGVAPDKAFQTLLAEPIRGAIATADAETFNRLIGSPGAPDIAEQVIGEPPRGEDEGKPDANFVMNATLLFSASSAKEELWCRGALVTLADHWIAAEGPAVWRADYPQVVEILSMSTRNSGAFVTASARILGKMIEIAKLDDESVGQIIAAMRGQRIAAQRLGFKAPTVRSNRKLDDLFIIVPKLDTLDRGSIYCDVTAESVVQSLVERLANEKLAGTVAPIIRAFAGDVSPQFKDRTKPAWDPLAQAAFDILISHRIDSYAIGPALDAIGLLRSRNKLAKALTERSFDEGRLASLGHEADNAEDDDLLADIATLMLLHGSDFAAPNSKSWAEILVQRPRFAQCVEGALRWYLWEDGTTFALKALPSRPAFAPVIWEIARRNIELEDAHGIDTSYLLENVEPIEEALGTAAFEQAIAHMHARENFWAVLEAVPLGRSFDRLVRALNGAANVDQEQLIALVRKRLDAVTLAGWRDVLLEGVAPFGLVEIYRTDLGQAKPLGEDLRGALDEQTGPLLQSASSMRQRWFAFAQFISNSARITLFRKLRDTLLAGSEVADLGDLITIGGAQLFEEGNFAADADKTARHIVFPLARLESGRSVIVDHADFLASIVDASDTETRTALGELLANEGEVNESASHVAALRSILNFD